MAPPPEALVLMTAIETSRDMSRLKAIEGGRELITTSSHCNLGLLPPYKTSNAALPRCEDGILLLH